MAKFFDSLDDELIRFIEVQHLFFVATAPVKGRINLSPKGMNTFRVFDSKRVGYLDLTGSGAETCAHVQENARMTIMFCSFDRQPQILRLYGRGEVTRPRDPGWDALFQHFYPMPGQRQIISMEIATLQTSCGFSIPLYEFKGERETLMAWAEKKGPDGLRDYWNEKNRSSIDGLPTRLQNPL